MIPIVASSATNTEILLVKISLEIFRSKAILRSQLTKSRLIFFLIELEN